MKDARTLACAFMGSMKMSNVCLKIKQQQKSDNFMLKPFL